MAIIAFIVAEDVIEKILKHLGLWEVKPRPVCVHRTGRPPSRMPKSPPLYTEPHIDYSDPSTRATASVAVGPRSGWGPEGRKVFEGSP